MGDISLLFIYFAPDEYTRSRIAALFYVCSGVVPKRGWDEFCQCTQMMMVLMIGNELLDL